MTTVELRCPMAEPWGLLGKVQLADGPPRIVEENLVELRCGSCSRLARRDGRPVMVLHRFNILGDLVESVEIANRP